MYGEITRENVAELDPDLCLCLVKCLLERETCPAFVVEVKLVCCSFPSTCRALFGKGNEAFLIRVWKLFPNGRVLKTLRGSLKRTISVSGGFELLQMVSKLDIG